MIEKVCPLLPESLAEQCKGFLDIYGPVLLRLIVQDELSPNQICKDLGLCSSSFKLPGEFDGVLLLLFSTSCSHSSHSR